MIRDGNLWQRTYRAYRDYIELRMQIYASPDFDEQMAKALDHDAGRKLALRTLKNVATAHIGKHAAAIFKEATSGNSNARLAGEVLARLDPDEATKILDPLILDTRNRKLLDPEVRRRIVDLLKVLDQEVMIGDLMTSDDFTGRVEADSFVPEDDGRTSLGTSLNLIDQLDEVSQNSDKWEHELHAEQQFLSLREELINDPNVGEYLREGLADVHGRGLAIDIMFDLPVKYTKQNIAEVFDDATSTNGYFDMARDLLARLEFSEATEILWPLVEQRLATDDNTWEAYLRSAELLGELGQVELLDNVVLMARASTDPDVLDTAEYYDSGTFTRLDRVALRQSRGVL